MNIPDDIWFTLLEFLPVTDVFNCSLACIALFELVFDVQEDHPNYYAQQMLWKRLCYTTFEDKSVEERERRSRSDCDAFYSHTAMSERIFDQFYFDYASGENANLHLYDVDNFNLQDFCWREMFIRILTRREEWKDCLVRKRQKANSYWDYCDHKAHFDLNVLRFVVCGRASAQKDLFINKLIKLIGKDTDHYDIALNGIEQVIHLKNVNILKDVNLYTNHDSENGTRTVDSVMLYTVESPYHFAKQFRGSVQVNGVIYIVDTNSFLMRVQKSITSFITLLESTIEITCIVGLL
jgi:hypothetical protein